MNEQQLAVVKQAVEALDIAQGLLADAKSYHQPKMLAAYTALQSIISQDALDKKAAQPAVPEELKLVREWAEKWAAISYEDSWKYAAREVLTMLATTPVQPALVSLTDGVTVPLEVLEAAEESLGSFCSDHGWSDKDMQNMDNLSAHIARHKAAHGITKGQQ
jgi:hypothetical protein